MSDIKRILVVEDSPTVIEMMRIMLKDYNVKIQTAGSEFGMFQSIEAFGKIVDLVIMDITLKSENGLDLVEKIRQNAKYQELPVIIVTEHAKAELILRAKGLNVRSYIRKPIEKKLFIERISEVITLEQIALGQPAIVIEPQEPPSIEESSDTSVAADANSESSDNTDSNTDVSLDIPTPSTDEAN